MPTALPAYAEAEREAGRPLEGPFVFHCAHRAFGVGMIDVRDVLAADRAIAARGRSGGAAFSSAPPPTVTARCAGSWWTTRARSDA